MAKMGRNKRRIKALLEGRDEPMSAREIARILDINTRSVSEYVKKIGAKVVAFEGKQRLWGFVK